jgi:hypothetical protein
MPRQPIIDAHEWISEIVPNCYSAKRQGKGTGLWVSAGKEDPVEFDSSLMLCSDMRGVALNEEYLVGSSHQLEPTVSKV